jgi:type II secretory pathway pseudopilin PulG
MTVVAIMGIIGVTALPALSSARTASIAGLADRVAIELTQARARAMAEGVPHGVTISAGAIQPLTIPAAGDLPEAALTALGAPSDAITLEQYEPGVPSGATGGDGLSTFPITVWFSIDGTPHTRNALGATGQPWTGNAAVTIARRGGASVVHRVIVHRVSGFVEVVTP